MSYTMDFGSVWPLREALLRGAGMTALLTLAATGIGLALGLLLALLRGGNSGPLRYLAMAYIEIFRTTPALVQLFWIYYSLPIFTGIQLSSFTSVGIGLGMHSAAYFAEIFRAGIESVERGQTHAARSLGMSRHQALRRIVLPQALQRMVPPLINEFVNLSKLTTLASTLAVYELMHEANNIIIDVQRPLEVYTVLAAIFFIILFPITLGSKWLEQRWVRRRY
ncbi:amino acid ABC transporter permease [Pigmentiphaga soli]|uniref:Amino acid ABC transporter permease n=1 Tax=Pigmentiphaga soli TaxID=1007095 RepID=A0ABP8GPW1_9BURK